MKRIVVALVVLLSILTGGVAADAQMRRAVTAGVNITSMKFKQDLISIDNGVGYTAGVMGELMFPGIGFGLDIGAMYEQRGATLALGQREIWASQGYGNERVYLHYLLIPVHFRFKYTNLGGIEEFVAPFVYGGPEFGLQVGHGSIKRNGQSAIKYSGGDLGLTVGFGVEIKERWQLSGSYTWGMTYALKTKLLEDFSARTNTWNVRLAYFF